jgi:hypothetical protein
MTTWYEGLTVFIFFASFSQYNKKYQCLYRLVKMLSAYDSFFCTHSMTDCPWSLKSFVETVATALGYDEEAEHRQWVASTLAELGKYTVKTLESLYVMVDAVKLVEQQGDTYNDWNKLEMSSLARSEIIKQLDRYCRHDFNYAYMCPCDEHTAIRFGDYAAAGYVSHPSSTKRHYL